MTQARDLNASPQPSVKRLAIILAVLACLLYANSIGNGYVLDDVVAITNNRIVTEGFSGIPELLHTPYLHGAMHNPNDLYRPLPLVTFALEWGLFESSPGISHAVNVLLFACCCVLLFVFLDRLFERKQRTLVFIAALLFALHPIHTEVVANIKSRDELLCFLFAFGALHQWLLFSRSGKTGKLLLGSLFFFLSLISKETSLSFTVLVPLLFFLWLRPAPARSIAVTGSLLAVTAIVLAIRFSVLNAYDANHPLQIIPTENALAAAKTYGERLATAILILGRYLKLLLVPYPLRSDYSFNTIPLTGFSDWRVLLSLLIHMGVLAAGAWLLWKRRMRGISLGIILYLVPLALFANVFFLVGATMAERFLFFPSVGFCVAISALLVHVFGKKRELLYHKAAYAAMGAIALVCGFVIVQRNADWKDELTLFRTDYARTPGNFRLPYYIGSRLINAANEAAGDSLQRAALLTEALHYTEESISIYPAFATTHAQAGITSMNLGRLDTAQKHFLVALSLDTRDSFSRNNLAGVFFKKGEYRRSIEQCRINLLQYPGHARSYLNVGACYLRMGVPDSAAQVLQKVLELEPGNQTAAYYLSVARSMAAGGQP